MSKGPFQADLERCIAGSLEGGAHIEDVASACGISARTLQRHLARERVSYSALVDTVRLRIALRRLAQPEARMIDISTELGYRDPGSFSRAFRRWTGRSPRAKRQELLTT